MGLARTTGGARADKHDGNDTGEHSVKLAAYQ
jgi:hypothetical protein